MSSLRVLVVDDEPDIRELLVADLEDAGYVIRELENGLQVIGVALDFRPDVIVLDIGMPVFDGFEVLKELKVNPQTAPIPVIIASAQTGKAAQTEARNLGAVDFMTKPWEDGELVWRIQQVVKRSKDLAA
ncbi:MAG: response regulator [Dehalococcoidia bacterium]|nr:response regulator [Dehalococcoidia bacterium]